jgi:hypothetical protein
VVVIAIGEVSMRNYQDLKLQEDTKSDASVIDFENMNLLTGGSLETANPIGGGNVGYRGGGGGGGGGGRVICTHFFKKGMIDRDLWRSDLVYTYQNLSPTTVRGYQAWAIPYVRLMRRSQIAEKVMYPLALWRAEEIAFRVGVRKKGNLKGKIVRFFLEPACFALGLVSRQKNWESLWIEEGEASSGPT